MAQCEDINKNNTMDVEVVCISDDEEREDGASITANTKQQQPQSKRISYNHNEYENYGHVPPSVHAILEARSKLTKQEELRKFEEQINNADDVVVYVPDDNEEENLLIKPIQTTCHEIKFGQNIFKTPTKFPYNLLIEVEKHINQRLRNVSFTTGINVWNCVMVELNLIRTAYELRKINVSNSLVFNYHLCFIFVLFFLNQC